MLDLFYMLSIDNEKVLNYELDSILQVSFTSDCTCNLDS
jgi:hypothetical protein